MHLIPCALNIGQFTTVYRYGALSMSLKLWPAKCQSNQWHVLLVPKTSLTSQHCKHSAKQLIHSKNKTESAVSIPFTTKTHNRTCTHRSCGNRTVTMETSTNGAWISLNALQHVPIVCFGCLLLVCSLVALGLDLVFGWVGSYAHVFVPVSNATMACAQTTKFYNKRDVILCPGETPTTN